MDSARSSLTNNDFRKLLTTPRAPTTNLNDSQRKNADNNKIKAVNGKKKKKYYPPKQKNEEEKEEYMKIDTSYRDRAKERREGLNPDYNGNEALLTTYKNSEIPDVNSNWESKRQKIIRDSKYLGGDMQHTHLVKGLDFALLHKARSEVEPEEEDEIEIPLTKSSELPIVPASTVYMEKPLTFSSILAKNIYNHIFCKKVSEKNELFIEGRMAYVFKLDEPENDEIEVLSHSVYDSQLPPTSVIRSKSDVNSSENTSNSSSNSIVIQKLSQILSYLRQGQRNVIKTSIKQSNLEPSTNSLNGEKNIFNEIPIDTNICGKTLHSFTNENSTKYFGCVSEKLNNDCTSEADNAHEYVKKLTDQISKKKQNQLISTTNENESKLNMLMNVEGSYAECYPGAIEMEDAAVDSDDEADYEKMDPGKRRVVVNRFDFDTDDDYNQHMERREALPKAAFQYGVKMSDGRKTRRNHQNEEKTKIDREWTKISQILSKRQNEKK